MQLIRHSFPPIFTQHGCVATIGNFDGVHRGHLALLERLVSEAKARGIPSVVILFEPHPREFLASEKAPARLTLFREKIQRLKQLPIDYILCLRFNQKLANLTAEEFIQKILVNGLHVKHILIGDDFRFGQQRQGDVTLLTSLGEKYGYTLEVFPTFFEHNERVSSTAVREALSKGDLKTAEQLLGRVYTISGHVKRGAGRGHEFGFPTANIAVSKQGLPLSGVFCVRVSSETLNDHPAVANVGIRPTVDGTRTVIEVLLLDFEGNLYGQHLDVKFLHKLRDEKKFDNVELLKAQIKKDVTAAQHYYHFSP